MRGCIMYAPLPTLYNISNLHLVLIGLVIFDIGSFNSTIITELTITTAKIGSNNDRNTRRNGVYCPQDS